MSLPQFTSSDWMNAASDSGGPENASKPRHRDALLRFRIGDDLPHSLSL